jgi:hypothetical protein
LPYAGITPAKPSGDHTPLGGFVSRRQENLAQNLAQNLPQNSPAYGIWIWPFQALGAKGATGKTGS